MSWNVEAAVTHVINNAAPTPIQLCGQYVREAINAGGLNVVPAGYAGYYGDNLTNQGFQLIETIAEKSGDTPWTTQFRKGDVVIYDIMLPYVKYGHAQMYSGTKWYSDYSQRGFWCYTSSRPGLRIYRYPRLHHTPTPSEPTPPPVDPPQTPGRPPGNQPPANRPPASRPPTPSAGGGTTSQHQYPGQSRRVGNRGESVQLIQEYLTAGGWPLEADGVFGRLTRSAVVSFQQTRSLVPDGVVGPNTWLQLFQA